MTEVGDQFPLAGFRVLGDDEPFLWQMLLDCSLDGGAQIVGPPAR
jgi:hypothetical protein